MYELPNCGRSEVHRKPGSRVVHENISSGQPTRRDTLPKLKTRQNHQTRSPIQSPQTGSLPFPRNESEKLPRAAISRPKEIASPKISSRTRETRHTAEAARPAKQCNRNQSCANARPPSCRDSRASRLYSEKRRPPPEDRATQQHASQSAGSLRFDSHWDAE